MCAVNACVYMQYVCVLRKVLAHAVKMVFPGQKYSRIGRLGLLTYLLFQLQCIRIGLLQPLLYLGVLALQQLRFVGSRGMQQSGWDGGPFSAGAAYLSRLCLFLLQLSTQPLNESRASINLHLQRCEARRRVRPLFLEHLRGPHPGGDRGS